MRRFLSLLLAAITMAAIPHAYGQVYPETEQAVHVTRYNVNYGNLWGKIYDKSSGNPIAEATIQLFNDSTELNAPYSVGNVVATLISSRRGEFTIDNLNTLPLYRLRVFAVGYLPYEQFVKFDVGKNISIEPGHEKEAEIIVKNLGVIRLLPDSNQLENVTVNANRPLMEMRIDRKIYNPEKDLTVTGGDASDILSKLPGVVLDALGNPIMRNASPQIFIDGRPTTLSLEQVPADQVASVEIITNPSAKYDAGGGGGIINFVLKKNRKPGYNGSIRASIDKRGKPGFGAEVNMRQGKMNYFAAGNLQFRKSLAEIETSRRDSMKDKIGYLSQHNTPLTTATIGIGRIGIDYLPDSRNIFSLSSNLVKGVFHNSDNIFASRDTVFTNRTTHQTSTRDLKAITNFRNMGFTGGYRHNFARPDRELVIDGNYNESNTTNTSDYQSYYFDGLGNLLPPAGAERATGGGKTQFITAQADYVNPISEGSKFETGLRFAHRNFNSLNDNYIQSTFTQVYEFVPEISVAFNFDDVVYAGYASFSRQAKQFSYQAGLRLESSNYNGKLVSKNQSFTNRYPISLFPSLYLTKKISPHEDLQLNFSRKINRPGFYQIIPFIDFSDSLNLSIGFPDLKPEFHYLAELNYILQKENGNSLTASVYGKTSENIILRYQYRDANPNPAKTDSVIYNSYINASGSQTAGLELIARNKINEYWDILASANFYHVSVDAANIALTPKSALTGYFAKIVSTIKFTPTFSLQVSSDYQSKTILPVNSGRSSLVGSTYSGSIFGTSQVSAQGYIKPFYSTDLALKKDFLKNNAASLTLQFTDIFRTKKLATHAQNSFLVQDYSRRRDPQFARLNFSWRFGKQDMGLFKRRAQRAELENLQVIPQ